MAVSPPPVKPPVQKAPIPGWAWVFVALCVLMPIVTVGGAIPGGVGGGGAATCVGVARNAQMPVGARVGICAAITAAVWVVFAVLISTMARAPR